MLGDASVSRTVIEMRNHHRVQRIVSAIPKIWESKEVLIVEGKGTDFGVGNALMDGAIAVHRIEAKEKSKRFRAIRTCRKR